MGKIVRFDSSRRRISNEAVKREIMAAARRAGGDHPGRRKSRGWNPSNQLIVSIGIAAFIAISAVLHYSPMQAAPIQAAVSTALLTAIHFIIAATKSASPILIPPKPMIMVARVNSNWATRHGCGCRNCSIMEHFHCPQLTAIPTVTGAC
jgi:hypothetical protein